MLSPNGSSGTCIPDGVYHIPMPCLHGATNPPVRPVRETFASYGSRERDVMGHFHFASSTAPSPWTALRVRWVPLYYVPTLSLRVFALCAAFPRSDYYAQFDCLQGLGVSSGSPHFYSPPSFTSLAGFPVFTVEDSKQNAVGGVVIYK